jgi:hypothetical protein
MRILRCALLRGLALLIDLLDFLEDICLFHMLVHYMVASLGLMPLYGVNKGYEYKKYKDDKLCAISAARASSSGSGVIVKNSLSF